MAMYQDFPKEQHDDLIYSTNTVAEAFMVTIKAGEGVLKRGALLAYAGAETVLSHMKAASIPNCILAEDVDATTTAIKAMAYRAGHFNEVKLNVKTGYTLTAADKETLRGKGILLSDAFA